MINGEKTCSVPLQVRSVAGRCAALLAMMCWVTCGCSGRDPNLPPTAPVSGQVTYNGQPVNQGTITFHPVGEGNPGVSLLDENGYFELSTYEAGDGAVVGQHAVTIDIPPPLDGTSPEDQYSVPDRYTDPASTPLKVEVSEDGEDMMQLTLED